MNTDSETAKFHSARICSLPHIGHMEFRENYWESPPHKAEFIRFLAEIHNLDLSTWDRRGYWDPLYRPFSLFDGDTLAANVCLYSMDMVVAGQRTRVAQISGVGTRPDYRRRGLSRDLTQRAIEWARPDHHFFYLFADEEAVPLYEKFGFRWVIEHKTRIEARGTRAIPGAIKLDITIPRDRDLVFRMASERTTVSDQLGVNNPRLFMFWALYGFSDQIHHVPDLNLLVVHKRDGASVTVHDLVGPAIPPFAEIYPYIASPNDHVVEFTFMTDKLGLAKTESVPVEGDTFVMGDFPLAGTQFIFPLAAQA